MEFLKFITNGIRVQAKNARGWIYLGWMDFTIPYRTTFVGPLWEILSALFWIAGLGIVFYSPDFESMSHFIIYIAAGIVIFTYIGHILNSTPGLYHSAASTMSSIKISPAFFILRNIVLNIIRFACQLLVAFGAVAYFADLTDVRYFELLLGTLVMIFTSIWVSLLLASTGARFPDIIPTIIAITRALLFITPVFWTVTPDTDSLRNVVALANPLTYFIEIMREPMMGNSISTRSWAVVLGINLILVPVSLIVYRVTRYRILNWV